MGEQSEKLQSVSETEIVLAFRRALVTLLPILQQLDFVVGDTFLYDSFERVAEGLWGELVLDSLRWKYGLDESLKLPRYGGSILRGQTVTSR